MQPADVTSFREQIQRLREGLAPDEQAKADKAIAAVLARVGAVKWYAGFRK